MGRASDDGYTSERIERESMTIDKIRVASVSGLTALAGVVAAGSLLLAPAAPAEQSGTANADNTSVASGTAHASDHSVASGNATATGGSVGSGCSVASNHSTASGSECAPTTTTVPTASPAPAQKSVAHFTG